MRPEPISKHRPAVLTAERLRRMGVDFDERLGLINPRLPILV
jgi:hypothetical protein